MTDPTPPLTARQRTSIVETHGACTQHGDPRAWDLPNWGSALSDENRLALRICRERCPVRAACALETLAAPDYPHGTIRAGVQLRRETNYEPSPRSLALLRSVAGDAA